MGSCSLTRARAATQDGQGPELGRILRGAAADVQGLLQADGHQQRWPAGQERLRGAFDNVGVLMSESELDGLPGEISGPCTYDNMVKMFQEKMAGDGNDSDDLIIQAFKAYDIEGKMDVKMFQHALKTWGDKMTQAEIDDIFGEFDIYEDYMVKTKEVLGLFVAQKEEEKKEEAPVVEESAPPAEEEEGRQVNMTCVQELAFVVME